MNLLPFLATFISSLVLLWGLPPVAHQIGLLDYPDRRKHHQTAVPMIGGVAIALAVSVGILVQTSGISTHRSFLLGVLVISVVGIVDDLMDLPYRIKLSFQILVAALIVLLGGQAVTHIGHIFFSNTGYGLGPFSQIFSIIAIVGLMNAYNMIDGHDGLAGGCAVISLLSVCLLLSLLPKTSAPALLILFLTACAVFLFFNLESVVGPRRQVFLGDAGSLMLGLTVAYFLIKYSGLPASKKIPVTVAPWLVGLPLLDMVAVMTRRLVNRRSLFRADRIHFHHIMMDCGVSKGRVLLLGLVFQALLSGIGILGFLRGWADRFLFWGLFLALVIYLLLIRLLNSKSKGSHLSSAS